MKKIFKKNQKFVLNSSMRYLLSILFCSFLFSNTINIPQDYLTIQEGINAVTDGDTVFVFIGTYYENIDFNGKDIAVIGEDIETTIIDGSNTDWQGGSIVTIEDYDYNWENNEVRNPTLMNFKIKNGFAVLGPGVKIVNSAATLKNLIVEDNEFSNGGGGTIFINRDGQNTNNQSVIIDECHIRNNHGNGNGAGIKILNWSHVEIKNSIIEDNTCDNYFAGGIYASNGVKLIVQNTIFKNNEGRWYGGGLHAYEVYDLQVTNCLFLGNHGDKGGAIAYEWPSIESWQSQNNVTPIVAVISNNTFVNNQGNQGSTIYIRDSELNIKNSIIWNNENFSTPYIYEEPFSNINITYSDIQFGYEGEGNINLNPLFIDASEENFNIQSSSPCIDAGDPNSEYDPDGTIADMGAYYYHQLPGCTGDNACNYNPEATIDDGSCIYPEENYDCNGNCLEEIDCSGVCGGELEPDCCGVCGGDNSTCDNCCFSPFYDDCSDDCVYDEDYICCTEYDLDECGVCFGDGTSCETPGDLNGDGTINVVDIVVLVGLILDGGDYTANADMNQDGQMNVVDIVVLVTQILNP